MIPVVDQDKCDGCESCVDACPTESIAIVDGKAVINLEDCVSTARTAAWWPAVISPAKRRRR